MDDIEKSQDLLDENEACDEQANTNLNDAIDNRDGQAAQIAAGNAFDEEDAQLKEDVAEAFEPIEAAIAADEPVPQEAFDNAAHLIALRKEHLDKTKQLNAEPDEDEEDEDS